MRLLLVLPLTLLNLAPLPAQAIASEIESHVDRLRQDRLRQIRQSLQAAASAASSASTRPNPEEAQADHVEQLEAAIRKGDVASGQLRKQIATLEADTRRLSDEKQQLVTVQTALTSGLVGALITAAVALAGAFANFRRSRADRDYRRLEVIEKCHLLIEGGMPIPSDLAVKYLAVASRAPSPSKSALVPNQAEP